MIRNWPCPGPDGILSDELAICLDQQRERRLLILPALFDEANRLRRLTVETMRRLDRVGVDSFLPDLPGTNESLVPLASVALAEWRAAATAAARHFDATHVLAIRGAALIVPQDLPGWRLAPLNGATLLRQMLRMRILTRREAGFEETQSGLIEAGLSSGLELGGYSLSAQMLADLQQATPPEETGQTIIGQDMLGGPALWLRAEPDESPVQADSLAAIIAIGSRE